MPLISLPTGGFQGINKVVEWEVKESPVVETTGH